MRHGIPHRSPAHRAHRRAARGGRGQPGGPPRRAEQLRIAYQWAFSHRRTTREQLSEEARAERDVKRIGASGYPVYEYAAGELAIAWEIHPLAAQWVDAAIADRLGVLPAGRLLSYVEGRVVAAEQEAAEQKWAQAASGRTVHASRETEHGTGPLRRRHQPGPGPRPHHPARRHRPTRPDRPGNLGNLNRRHHRLKTHAPGWTLTRRPRNRYWWTTPSGKAILVDRHGTHPLPRMDVVLPVTA